MQARATVSLHRLPVGRVVEVDADDEYVRMLLGSGMLVAVGDEPEPQNPAAAPDAEVDEAGDDGEETTATQLLEPREETTA